MEYEVQPYRETKYNMSYLLCTFQQNKQRFIYHQLDNIQIMCE